MTIQDILNAFNLSRSDLANELGIPKRTVQDWALGNRKPPDYVVRLIYEHYKLTANKTTISSSEKHNI